MPTVRQRGNRFQAQVRIKRNGVIVYQESASFDTLSAANRWGVTLEATIERDGVTGRTRSVTTVKDLIDGFVEKRRASDSIGRGIDGAVTALLKAPFADTPLANLTASELVTWAAKCKKEGRSPATILQHMAIFRSAVNSAPALLNVDADPRPIKLAMAQMKLMQVIAKSEARDRRVSDEELDLIDADFKKKADDGRTIIPMGTIFRMAVALPRRQGELLDMLWSDISKAGDTILLRDTKHPTKTRNELIPLPPAAQDMLKTIPKIDERILPYKANSVGSAWKRMRERQGLPDVRFHDLRHEGISRLFEAGLDIPEVALISGHEDWAMLKRYTHLRPSTVAEKLKNARKQAT